MYYFAYSTNMSLDHMRRLCGWHFSILGQATLTDYEFGLDLRGFVSVAPKKGKKVFGVLYKVDQQALDALDDFEGYPQVYLRPEVEVTDSLGQSHKSWIYMEPAAQLGGKFIKEDHLKRIIAGAAENRLPEDWLKFLESLRSKVNG